MRIIKSLFIAIMAIVMTTVIASATVFIIDDFQQSPKTLKLVNALIGNVAHAQEADIIKDDTQHNANHTFSPSLNTHTPSEGIDQSNLPIPSKYDGQSPSDEGQEEYSEYVDILVDLVPISGEDISYEEILGISEEEIKLMLESQNISIWDIATEVEEVHLLENVYFALYPARIIDMLHQGLITEDMVDVMIATAMQDIRNHRNTTLAAMLDNLSVID